MDWSVSALEVRRGSSSGPRIQESPVGEPDRGQYTLGRVPGANWLLEPAKDWIGMVDTAGVRNRADRSRSSVGQAAGHVALLNKAGIFPMRATKNARGWDNAFATNHIGPFVLTESLIPHLPDGANVVFVASGV